MFYVLLSVNRLSRYRPGLTGMNPFLRCCPICFEILNWAETEFQTGQGAGTSSQKRDHPSQTGTTSGKPTCKLPRTQKVLNKYLSYLSLTYACDFYKEQGPREKMG